MWCREHKENILTEGKGRKEDKTTFMTWMLLGQFEVRILGVWLLICYKLERDDKFILIYSFSRKISDEENLDVGGG
jgi:hypothetical protein